ncbi:PRC-barrel domain-containing protein [Ornithinimicrobium cryptoxanthini]|uniref:PRC-barrel domain-containing protein n=1 Tax=Ornithinimicrobium cryptoxanthini TaxID=2934161 RepID=UPI00211891EE|nr:PRC-barrel domain-containing protein [Ornithinimicrobium cryptoxanthini]
MPINSEHLASLTDADVIDQNGDKVGSVGQIYLDDATGQPAWASVKSGLFGLRESFVPLNDANVADGNIQVPYTKDQVKDSPRVDAEDHLDDSQQSTLFSYYGVDRAAATGDQASAGAPDSTAMFGSDETAQDMTSSRTEGIPTEESQTEEARDGAVTSEYTTPGVDDVTTGAGVGDSGNDLGSGSLTESGTTTGSEDGDGDADRGDAQSGVFQEATPAGDADWSAEQEPAAPTSQPWAMPSSDPADEEPTDANRSGYTPDQPAAHAAAYEGRGEPADSAAGSSDGEQFGTVEPVTADSGPDIGSTTGDYGEFERIEDQQGRDAAAADDGVVSGSQSQTGTGYPQDDRGGLGAAGAAVGGAASAGYAADVSTTAYETPGAETGDPVTGTTPPAAFASDVEQPADGLTRPDDTQTDDTQAAEAQELEAHAGEVTDEESTLAAGTDAGVDETGEPEVFGPEGYRPDRDGTEMSDEERERLNQARSAL